MSVASTHGDVKPAYGELRPTLLGVGIKMGTDDEVVVNIPWIVTDSECHKGTPLLGTGFLARVAARLDSRPDQPFGAFDYRVYTGPNEYRWASVDINTSPQPPRGYREDAAN